MSTAQPGLTLILGGVRAGKTAFAERLAARHGPRVLYVATAEPYDAEMRDRIARHQAGRPATWQTLEAPLDPTDALATAQGDAVLLDCLTVWTSNLLLRHIDPDAITPASAAHAEHTATEALDVLLAWQARTGTPLYIVSNEVGLGVTPPYPLGRVYQDVLGRLNQRVARVAGSVYLVIAGLALDLRAVGAIPTENPPPLE